MKEGITLTLDIEEEIPPLNVDVNYIDQVISNLIDNAIKYTLWRKGGGEGGR